MKPKNRMLMGRGVVVLVFLAVVVAPPFNSMQGLAANAAPVTSLGTGITYQGRLTDGGVPANGSYDFQFILYDTLTGGSQVGPIVPVNDLPVTDGMFSAVLDFGSIFNGAAVWLEVGVRAGSSSGVYSILSPRQPLTATPYALGLQPGAVISSSLTAPMLTLANTDQDGLSISHAGGNGILVGSVSSNGIDVESAGLHGIYVKSAASSGLQVDSATFGVEVKSVSGDGIYVINANLHGVVVLSAGNNGVDVETAGYNGVSISTAGTNGIIISRVGADGFKVCATGGDIGCSGDAYGNGFEVGKAHDYGVRVFDAGRAGFRVDNPVTNGFYAYDAGDSGVWIRTATNYAGFFGGNINVTGSCTGCVLATFGVNKSQTTLLPGDLVSSIGVSPGIAANTEMLIQAAPASAGQSIVGVVAGRAERSTSEEDGSTNLVPHNGEAAEPGEYVSILIYGPVQLRASSLPGGIAPGMKLALDVDGLARPLRTVDVNGIKVAESAPTIGIALAEPDESGLVWVLLNPQ